MPRSAILILLLAAPVALAQSSGGSYVLRKQAIAGGGTRASAGALALTHTIGQPHAAVASGGSYRLTGGFHAPRAAAQDPLFANGFE